MDYTEQDPNVEAICDLLAVLRAADPDATHWTPTLNEPRRFERALEAALAALQPRAKRKNRDRIEALERGMDRLTEKLESLDEVTAEALAHASADRHALHDRIGQWTQTNVAPQRDTTVENGSFDGETFVPFPEGRAKKAPSMTTRGVRFETIYDLSNEEASDTASRIFSTLEAVGELGERLMAPFADQASDAAEAFEDELASKLAD